MKTTIKMRYLILGLIALFTMASCDNEDYLVFTAQEPVEKVSFTNEPNTVYKIFDLIPGNVLERLIWSAPDFEAPTTITYVLEGSLNSDFSTIDYSSGETSENQVAVTIGNVLTIAEDNDLEIFPMHFRVTAFVGDADGNNPIHSVSDPVTLNIELVVIDNCEEPMISTFGLIGDAAPGGWASTNDRKAYLVGDGAYTMAITLTSGVMKIRENNDWAVNYGVGAGGEGTLTLGGFGNDIPVASAGNYIFNFDLVNLTYSLSSSDVLGIIGDAAPGGWGSTNDVKLIPDPCTEGVYLAQNIAMTAGVFKIRQNNDWGVNYGLGDGGEGTLTLGGFGNDIPVAEAGTYDLIVDLNNMTYTLSKQ